MKHKTKTKPAAWSAKPNPFSGNITIARGRFRRMAELALKKMQAQDLNTLAFQTAVILDVKESRSRGYTREHSTEQRKSLAREKRRNARKTAA